MADNENFHILYKNLGETPHECILRWKNEHPAYKDESMTYAGRLDPMAEGLLLILSGEELHHKDKYLGLKKTYEFEVLWGFESDTLDLLGLVSDTDCKIPEIEEIKEYLKINTKKFEQVYPAFSSKPVNGKALFEWAKQGRLAEIEIPKHEVELFEADYVSRKFVSKNELGKNINSKVMLVKGDFRQVEILSKWEEVLKRTNNNEFVIDKFTITVSSGFYVRQFVADLAKNFGIKALTFHIKRTRVGEYYLPNVINS